MLSGLTAEIPKKQPEIPPLKALLPLCVRKELDLCAVNSTESRL